MTDATSPRDLKEGDGRTGDTLAQHTADHVGVASLPPSLPPQYPGHHPSSVGDMTVARLVIVARSFLLCPSVLAALEGVIHLSRFRSCPLADRTDKYSLQMKWHQRRRRININIDRTS